MAEGPTSPVPDVVVESSREAEVESSTAPAEAETSALKEGSSTPPDNGTAQADAETSAMEVDGTSPPYKGTTQAEAESSTTSPYQGTATVYELAANESNQSRTQSSGHSSASSSPLGRRRCSSSMSELRPTTPTTPNGEGRFLLLPHEIHSLVFHFCDWPTARALRQTCTQLRQAFTVLTTIRKVQAHRDALLARDDGSFPAPCYGCVRILPQDAFPTGADYEREMATLYDRSFRWRRCTECLMSSHNMPLGVVYLWGGRKCVHCRRCSKHRRWMGYFSLFEPPTYCGRCRDIRAVAKAVKAALKSMRVWIGLMGLLMVVFSAMTWVTIVRLWRGNRPFDEPVVSWAFFSSCHTLAIQIIYWILVCIWYYTKDRPRNRPHRVAERLLNSDQSVLIGTVEFVSFLVSMCMPFAVHSVATVPLLGWSTLSWGAAVMATLLRLCYD